MIGWEHRKVVEAGSVVFQEGEPGECAYIIERGRVEVSVLRNGRKVPLAIFSQGDVFGEMALINNAPRMATAIALERTELMSISQNTFQEKIALADPLVALFLRTLLERFCEARERLLSLAGLPDQWTHTVQVNHNDLYERDREYTVRALKFEEELEKAIDHHELQLFFQPIVQLKSRRIIGFEALVRWNHPEKGLLAPSGFIKFAEENGQIVRIGTWIFDEACRALKFFQQDDADRILFISINLSIKQFNDPHLIDLISNSINKWSVYPTQIKLEITETLLMENTRLAILTLTKLKRLGVSLAIDDFGTGYSSFNYLYRFPLDNLKIDQSFIQTMTTHTKSAEIVRSLVTLAHTLSLEVIAEGVENHDQLKLLQEFNCDCVQGELASAPVPLDEAHALLTDHCPFHV